MPGVEIGRTGPLSGGGVDASQAQRHVLVLFLLGDFDGRQVGDVGYEEVEQDVFAVVDAVHVCTGCDGHVMRIQIMVVSKCKKTGKEKFTLG